MADTAGYLYLLLGGVFLAHLWRNRREWPTAKRRGIAAVGLSFVAVGLFSLLGRQQSPVALALVLGLVLVSFYYAAEAWRRGETWWQD